MVRALHTHSRRNADHCVRSTHKKPWGGKIILQEIEEFIILWAKTSATSASPAFTFCPVVQAWTTTQSPIPPPPSASFPQPTPPFRGWNSRGVALRERSVVFYSTPRPLNFINSIHCQRGGLCCASSLPQGIRHSGHLPRGLACGQRARTICCPRSWTRSGHWSRRMCGYLLDELDRRQPDHHPASSADLH